MIIFSVIFIVPLLIAIGAFLFSKEICWKEMLCIVGVQFVIALISALLCYYSNVSDVEVWNGTIVSKKQEWVSCTHSYQCNCRTECSGTGKNRTCSTVCDTCYEHLNDWDWVAYTSNNERINIDRIDRRGSHEPPRWTAIKIGEPSSIEHGYTNYIKGSPDTLFRNKGLKEKYKEYIPKYPRVHDYYKINRVLKIGNINIDNSFNDEISILNSKVGPLKQANIIVIFAEGLPREYFYAIQEDWLGGKKNDIVIVIGVKNNKPEWSEVMAWSKNELFQVSLEEDIESLESISSYNLLNIIKENIMNHFERKPMKDFEYLKSSITPSGLQWTISLIIGFLISIGMSIFFHVNEVFPEYRSYNKIRFRKTKRSFKSRINF